MSNYSLISIKTVLDDSMTSTYAYSRALSAGIVIKAKWVNEHGRLFVIQGSKLESSTDGGVSWTEAVEEGTNAPLSSISGFNPYTVEYSHDIGVFIVAATNKTFRSTNGSTWVDVTPTTGVNMVVWSPTLALFVLPKSGSTWTSPDGITWTEYNSGHSASWGGGALWVSALGSFVAVGDGSAQAMTSADGITWTLGTTPPGAWWGLAWSPELGRFVSSNRSRIGFMSSKNGLTWTQHGSPVAGYTGGGVVWVPQYGRFYSSVVSGTTKRIILVSSADGMSWSIDSRFDQLGTATKTTWIEWSESLQSLIIVKETGACVFVSFDKEILPASAGRSNIITNLRGRVYIKDAANETSALSITGVYDRVLKQLPRTTYQDTMTVFHTSQHANLTSTGYGQQVYYVKEHDMIMLLNWNGDVFTSVDRGSTWVVSIDEAGVPITDIPNSSANMVAYSPSLDVFVLASWRSIFTSKDGRVWRKVPATLNASVLNAYTCEWSEKLKIFVILGNNGFSFHSADGYEWYAVPGLPAQNYSVLRWIEPLGLFIVTGNGVMTSPDGFTWTSRTTPNGAWWDIGWSSNMIVVTNSATGVITSPDGVTWTSRTLPAGISARAGVVWVPSVQKFMGPAFDTGVAGVRMIESADGITWSRSEGSEFIISSNLAHECWTCCWADGMGAILLPFETTTFNAFRVADVGRPGTLPPPNATGAVVRFKSAIRLQNGFLDLPQTAMASSSATIPASAFALSNAYVTLSNMGGAPPVIDLGITSANDTNVHERQSTFSSNVVFGSDVTMSNPSGAATIASAGSNIGIGNSNPSYGLDVVGDIYATGNILALSDCNYKRDILPITHALDKVAALQGYTFASKTEGDEKRYVGLLAQEVMSVLPEAVSTCPGTGRLSVAYGNMIGLLVSAVNDLRTRLDAQATLP